ncbi:MAG: hypothetical protein UT05_C0007G0036 [Parcubacteria group bacterium GW2011_GWF2_38_76]|nr:MAG: hypothetical protein UT05_C0007G0036 [Parcubacteria group bacterium GW2011_GWF2_38_76]HBM46088.1 hypothetical protein [Patescibacteria group bacterium]
MKYLPSKERNYKKIISYLSVIILLIGCFYFWHSSINYFLLKVGVRILHPFWSSQEYVSNKISYFLINFNDKEELIKKNDYLAKQIGFFKFFELENKLIREENLELKRLLGREGEFFDASPLTINKIQENKILAYVLSGPVTPPYDSLILDAGSEMGVAMGDKIIDESGFVMGEIVESFYNYSKARLLSAYGLKTNVFLGDNKTMIEMVGMGGGNFFVAMPNDFNVKESDFAMYPGPDFKKVAIVSRIEGKEGEMFKNIFLSVPFNVREIGYVAVIKKINL